MAKPLNAMSNGLARQEGRRVLPQTLRKEVSSSQGEQGKASRASAPLESDEQSSDTNAGEGLLIELSSRA